MKSLLTVAELEKRAEPASLPLDTNGAIDTDRIILALSDATGIIVAQLPWLLNDGELIDPVPAQFDAALKGICADIAVHRLTDTVTSSEDSRAWYSDSIKLLEKIDREFKGGLSGPDLHEASVVVGGGAEDAEDPRYWKKGKVL
ncbi:phage protein Gp36 family protein [Treponema denticola]|uniref:phage protein Gp36 family protein n=1 Tax=Treponema denticola TaxID=158 RepID=UPI0020A25394|nr:phage protein Gp36 family protein [Treponema denticola]UTC87891.1 DUF1320 family protein [Treponema denticola]